MRTLLAAIAACTLAGCTAIPDVVHQPRLHNPFPQLSRVAVLPFTNQSAEPTVDGEAVALAYYHELQQIPGFEVMPVGVARLMELQFTRQLGRPLTRGDDFQKLAQFMDVDAVVVASVTEFSPYYPPRMGLAVRWYAANPCFHPIPAGYGLPWGTAEEEYIPDSLVFEAEFALAKAQLETQTPRGPGPQSPAMQAPPELPGSASPEPPAPEPAESASAGSGSSLQEAAWQSPPAAATPAPLSPDGHPAPEDRDSGEGLPGVAPDAATIVSEFHGEPGFAGGANLPADWPDPRGFVPPGPTPIPAQCLPQSSPVLSLTRLYHGNDEQFTEQLANYYYFRDDARFGGWQSYLQRSDDFIRFCCHLHVTELLAARGGAGKTRVVWRWPIGRYER